jgi:hypothetical protein
MRRTLFILFSFLVVSSLSLNAQMKLNLSQELTGERPTSFMENNLESNLKLELPPEVTNPDGNEFIKMWFVGLMADATFPLGDFGEGWSTGFSAHAMLGYMIARSLLLNISVGYVTFTEKESIEGYDASFSWIPVLLGLNYIFNPGKKFMPFIGLGVGLYLLSSSVSGSIFGQTFDVSATNTEFGIAPRLGAYFLVSAAMLLTLNAEYNMIFTSGSTTSAFGILFGAMFALH